MFPQWLAPHDPSRWTATYLQKQPYAQPGAAQSALPLLTWETLDGVLRSPLPLDVMTVSGGRMVDVPCPRSLADARALMSQGVSTVVRASERHDPALATLAASFGNVLPGETHIQLYLTPGGTNSYG